jgi:ComF family protein
MREMRILRTFLALLFPERATEELVSAATSLPLHKQSIGSTRTLLSYGDPLVRAAIIEAKYRKNERAVELLAGALRPELGPDTIVIPVPLSKKRLEARGYNQVEVVARRAGAKIENLLIRTRDTLPQTKLSGSARRRNMKSAFVASPAPRASYLLLDDVTTTGATLAAAAAALKEAGIEKVEVLALAH